MDTSKLYYISPRVTKWKYTDSLPGKLESFLAQTEVFAAFQTHKPTPVKIHFGSEGAFRGIRPVFVRKIVEHLYKRGAEPFVTDTVRIKGPAYLRVARDNGYSFHTVGAPVILADGMYGRDGVEVDAGEPIGVISVAGAIYDAEQMVVVSHCKGHIQAGFGGAIKNLSMGCVSASSRKIGQKPTRGMMHSPYWDKPFVWRKGKCSYCEACVKVCPLEAVYFEKGHIHFTSDCWKCTRCARVCPTGALEPTISIDRFTENLAIVAATVSRRFKAGRIVYMNFLMDIAPECDCMPASDTAVIADQGILIGTDPVAIDKASLDILHRSQPLPNSLAADKEIHEPCDIFQKLHHVSGLEQVRSLAAQGCGSLEYEIIPV